MLIQEFTTADNTYAFFDYAASNKKFKSACSTQMNLDWNQSKAMEHTRTATETHLPQTVNYFTS